MQGNNGCSKQAKMLSIAEREGCWIFHQRRTKRAISDVTPVQCLCLVGTATGLLLTENVSPTHSEVRGWAPAFSDFQPYQWECVQNQGSAACLKNEKPVHSMRFRCGFTFLAPNPFPYYTLPQREKVAICVTKELGRVAGLSCPGYLLSGFACAGRRYHTPQGGKLPSHRSSQTQCYHWQYLSFVLFPLLPAPSGMGSNPQLWQSLSCFS